MCPDQPTPPAGTGYLYNAEGRLVDPANNDEPVPGPGLFWGAGFIYSPESPPNCGCFWLDNQGYEYYPDPRACGYYRAFPTCKMWEGEHLPDGFCPVCVAALREALP